MAVEVLQTRQQIVAARRTLRERGISCLSPLPLQWCKRLNIATRNPVIGDFIKSWDVLRTVQALEAEPPARRTILDMGAYCSETLPILHKLGFGNLVGIDLNPRIADMPFADAIRYEKGDFLGTQLPPASVGAAVSISAIEHGFDADRLLTEIRRLLSPGGLFIASFDYWPDKISTDGIRLFGLDWRIFSRDEILGFLARAREFGLSPTGELALDASERPIRFAGRRYTFGWLALRRDG